MSRVEYKRHPNHFHMKSGKIQLKSQIEQNNNDRHQQSRTGNKVSKYEQNLKFNSGSQGCFKINDRSKGVKKGKTKTPAQDRLKKFEAKTKSAFAESLKQLVDLKTTASNPIINGKLTRGFNSGKEQNAAVKCTNYNVDAVKAAQIVVSMKPKTVAIRNDSISKIENSHTDEKLTLLTSNQLAEKGFQQTFHSHKNKKSHDVQVQSHMKLNDKSKGVKKVKSKTPAQDRLQKIVDKNKVAILESLKEIVDLESTITNPNDHRKSIGAGKPYVSCIEPSITDVVAKNITDNNNNNTESTYIVPDTNVFLNSLQCIKSVIEKGSKYSVMIPFVVQQELDQLKHRGGENRYTTRLNATRAIRFIFELLQSENKYLQGQTGIEDTNRLIDVKSPDDRILNCCLQLMGESKNVILVTNDLNLTNMAKFSGVETITWKKCLNKFQ